MTDQAEMFAPLVQHSRLEVPVAAIDRVYSVEQQGGSIEEQFLAFHHRNPHVMKELVRLAREAKRHGRERWGMKGCFEVLRWGYLTTQGSDFVLNNNFTALYARWIMRHYPDLDGFFETRKRQSA